MRGESPNQLDRYARGYNRGLTDGHYPKSAVKNWAVVILKTVACIYRGCTGAQFCPCVKASSKIRKGSFRKFPHYDRMVRAIFAMRGAGGCQFCASRDWLIPRLCASGHVHGLCHACWTNRLLKDRVPALIRRCPDTFDDAEAAMLTLASGRE